MAAGDVKTEYAASSIPATTLASLASDAADFDVGRQSDEVDNTTNKYLDYLLSAKIQVHLTTPVTVDTEIRIYVAGLVEDSTYPDSLGASDAAKTWTSPGILANSCVLAAVLAVDETTAAQTYYMAPQSVAAMFGGSCPKKFVMYITHNTGQLLSATEANSEVYVTPVYATAAQ